MAKDKNPYNYIEDYLLTVRSKGCFTVTQSELLEKFNISPKVENAGILTTYSQWNVTTGSRIKLTTPF